MRNVTTWLKSNWQSAKVVTKNFLEFTDAACLAAVSGWAIHSALRAGAEGWYMLLLVAGCVIALQAAVLLVRHFNKPGVQ